MSVPDSRPDHSGFLLVVLLAGLVATAVSKIGGREVAAFLMLVLAGISACVVYFDARAIGAGDRAETERIGDTGSWKPPSWAVWTLLCWPIFLPYYIWMRNKMLVE